MSRIKIGWASCDISTNAPVNIPGQFHIRVSKGVLDPVTATCLVLDGGEDTAIFISGDMVCAMQYLLDDIRGLVREKNPEIPVENILMGVTHAHTGASHYNDGFEDADRGEDQVPLDGISIVSGTTYRKYIAGLISDAVCRAYETRSEGGVAWGYGYAVVAHSRRTVYFDDLSERPGAVKNSTHGVNGHASMYGDTNDPMFSHYEAGADHFLNVMYTFDAEDKLTGAVVNVPCPSQCSEMEEYLSADYWHHTRLAIREKFGDIFILPQCAAAGDLAPRLLHYRKAQARRFRLKYGVDKPVVNNMLTADDPKGPVAICERRDIAERIAAGFEEVYAWAKKDIRSEVPVLHKVETVELPRRMIRDNEYADAKVELEKLAKLTWKTDGTPEERLYENSMLKASRDRLLGIIARYEIQDTKPTIPMEMHTIRVGDIAFASNRFELYMDYQHRIQARSPFEQTFIVQLAAQPGLGGGSYLCTERGAEGRGYSASMFCNQVDYTGGQILVEATLKSLGELAE